MSDTSTTPLALFGDPEGERWALLLGGSRPRLALSETAAAGDPPVLMAVEVESGGDGLWRLSAEGQTPDLKLQMGVAGSRTHEQGSALTPCRLSGTVKRADASLALDMPGVLVRQLPTDRIGSIRIFGSWFPDGHGVSLLGIRPRGAKGQDEDELDLIALGEQQKRLFDPRLSTTYGSDGLPRKAGIELWLGDEQDGEQHPLRVSAVAHGPGFADSVTGLSLRAQALRCLSRGDEGAGLYLLLQRS